MVFDDHFENELSEKVNLIIWPEEWLGGSQKGEHKTNAWMRRIIEFADGQSDRVDSMPTFMRAFYIVAMARIALWELVFFRGSLSDEIDSAYRLTKESNVAPPFDEPRSSKHQTIH